MTKRSAPSTGKNIILSFTLNNITSCYYLLFNPDYDWYDRIFCQSLIQYAMNKLYTEGYISVQPYFQSPFRSTATNYSLTFPSPLIGAPNPLAVVTYYVPLPRRGEGELVD